MSREQRRRLRDARRAPWRSEEARLQASRPELRRLIVMQVVAAPDEEVEPGVSVECTVAEARLRAAALAAGRGRRVVLRVYNGQRHRWYPMATVWPDGTVTDHTCT